MIVSAAIQKKWGVPNELEQKFNAKMLKKVLRAFNQLSGGSYFFIDHYRRTLIVESAQSRILCGYSKELATKEGFLFFERILKKETLDWQKRLSKLIMDAFLSIDEEDRLNLVLLSEMKVRQKNGKEQVIHYKASPFQLCENGNLWLELGCVSTSISREGHSVCVVDTKTHIRYDFSDHSFVSSKISLLTPKDEEILLLLVKNMLESEICEALNITKSKYHRMRNALFNKLEVDTAAGAVQRAHHLGLI